VSNQELKILYLSFYFEPDLCAGSFRNSPLAKELAQQAKTKNIKIHVVTTQPNRYASYSKFANDFEVDENMIINRIALPKHRSQFLDQIISFHKYFVEVHKLVSKESYHLVFASSSRLFTAYLGYRIAKSKKIPLYLDIRDIFTDTIGDVLKVPFIKKPLIKVLEYIELDVYRYAKHINIISGGFYSHFNKLKVDNITNFTHGIDEEFLDVKPCDRSEGNRFVITYAGNIGEGQGLHKIIPQVSEKLGDGFIFKIFGDGGQIEKLTDEIRMRKLKNVILEKPVNREKLVEIYKNSDFLFIHLNDYDAFKKVLPSKIFEFGAFNKPIIAGVSGFARKFIHENIDNTIIFHPGDVNDLVAKLKAYNYKNVSRKEFIDKFLRKNINKEMAASILSYL
jgi:hypothetical protein